MRYTILRLGQSIVLPWCSAQRIKIKMIAGGNHTTTSASVRWTLAGRKKPRPFGRGFLCLRYLFSRPVTRQLSSAYMCLTSVFGMGTGGPTRQTTRTLMDGVYPIVYIKSLAASNSFCIIAPFYVLCQELFQKSW